MSLTLGGGPTPRASIATIKEAVVAVLDEAGRGLTALEILPKINERLGVDYPRTSLSPQLSRLKAEKEIHLVGKHWFSGEGPENDATDLLSGGRDRWRQNKNPKRKAVKPSREVVHEKSVSPSPNSGFRATGSRFIGPGTGVQQRS